MLGESLALASRKNPFHDIKNSLPNYNKYQKGVNPIG